MLACILKVRRENVESSSEGCDYTTSRHTFRSGFSCFVAGRCPNMASSQKHLQVPYDVTPAPFDDDWLSDVSSSCDVFKKPVLLILEHNTCVHASPFIGSECNVPNDRTSDLIVHSPRSWRSLPVQVPRFQNGR